MLNNMQPVNEKYLKVCQMNGLKLIRAYSFTTDFVFRNIHFAASCKD